MKKRLRFTPEKKVVKEDGRHKPKGHLGHARGQEARDKILAFIKQPMKGIDVSDGLKMNRPLTNYYLRILLKEGKLKKQGRGNATRYVRG